MVAPDATTLAVRSSWQCGVCGEETFSSMAFGGGRLFAAGGETMITGTSYQGSVRELDPATGTQSGRRACLIPCCRDSLMTTASSWSADSDLRETYVAAEGAI